MPVIRQLEILNFRVVRQLKWSPSPGLNCLIGPGDTGKSTVLDAIDLALGARRSYAFNDADFFQMNVDSPIVIAVTLGELNDELLNIEKYGPFLRAFNVNDKLIVDEPRPGDGFETVLTVKLVVDSDLEPDWRLFSERAEAEGIERRLPWKHRELISPSRLGATSHHHLAWGSRSVLNKLTENTFDVSSVLSQLGRQTRQAFAAQQLPEITTILSQIQTIGENLGVPVTGVKACLDVNGVSLSNGAISLHNSDETPLRLLGTGSSRLLISGIQKAANHSSILLVDEAEFGLEPYRITRFLHELGSKDTDPEKQVFITTHSPHVLRELQAHQLHVIRRLPPPPPANDVATASHHVYDLGSGNDEQSTLRVCAEAFLSKKVIVCEGKTEIGLMRGVDLFYQDSGIPTNCSKGISFADGGGDSMFARAKVFSSLGYLTVLFKDSDKEQVHKPFTQEVLAAGIKVVEWGNNNSTEDAIFQSCPAELIAAILTIAIDRKGFDSVDAAIQSASQNRYRLDDCLHRFEEEHRKILAAAAGKKSWYKDIDPSEQIFRHIVCPSYKEFGPALTNTVYDLLTWARQ